MQGDVLDHLPAFVDVALGQGHVLVGLEVEAPGVRLAAAEAADCAGGGLEVNDVAVFDLCIEIWKERREECVVCLVSGKKKEIFFFFFGVFRPPKKKKKTLEKNKKKLLLLFLFLTHPGDTRSRSKASWIAGSSLSCFDPRAVFRPRTT